MCVCEHVHAQLFVGLLVCFLFFFVCVCVRVRICVLAHVCVCLCLHLSLSLSVLLSCTRMCHCGSTECAEKKHVLSIVFYTFQCQNYLTPPAQLFSVSQQHLFVWLELLLFGEAVFCHFQQGAILCTPSLEKAGLYSRYYSEECSCTSVNMPECERAA